MFFTGISDEAGADINAQIKATKALGWDFLEARAMYGANLALMTDKDFADLEEKLAEAKLSISCFSSGIANWAKPITQDPESSYDEMRKAIPRMQKLKIPMIRIMSFFVPEENRNDLDQFTDEVIKRMKVLVKMAEDGGIVCVHENCNNWGGLSVNNTLRLLDAIQSPAFKLVFDTGNPVFTKDHSLKNPTKMQSAWDFYDKVKEQVVYIHIKDGTMVDGKMKFSFPAEGDGDVRKILIDAFNRGYDGGISIEPHMVSVFHEPDAAKKAAALYDNYVEYGKRTMKIVNDIKAFIK